MAALTPAQQLHLAAALEVNAPNISAQAVQQINIAQHLSPVVYPQYNIGYPPGTQQVFLHAIIANPAPIQDQFAHTSAHTYSQFSVADLPPILFRLEPFDDYFTIRNISPETDVPVPRLHDINTRLPIRTARGSPLRYFSFLPRYVAQDVPGCLLEFWFRLDYRLEMNDIRMRMEEDSTGRIPDGNALNMRRVRFRERIGASAWGSSRTWPLKVDIQLIERLTPQQICLNTTMTVDLVHHRFLKPSFHPDNWACTTPTGQIQTYMDAILTPDRFLTNPLDGIPSRKMFATIALRHRLQTLAMYRGLGNNSQAYSSLDVADDPAWWHKRAGLDGRRINEIDGLTHREYMENQFGDSDFPGIRARNSVRGQAWRI